MSSQTISDDEEFWRIPIVKEKTGMSKTDIYRKIQQGSFPRSHRRSHRVAVWFATEVREWIRREKQSVLDAEKDLIG